MYWIQFYQKAIGNGALRAAVGDRSVIIVDGRLSFKNMAELAKEHNKKLRTPYDAFQIKKGQSFTRSTSLTNILVFGEDI